MKVDLFELANNHHWRTEFAFRGWGEPIPRYMGLPTDPMAMDEKSWTDFGFQNYYALLNCGFRMMPTAGTASGVHPVPLGWNRVYVHCPEGFSYQAWMEGLKAGRSFVTTGPMIWFDVNGKAPGHVFRLNNASATYNVSVSVRGLGERCRIEIVENGEIVKADDALKLTVDRQIKESTWLTARCWVEGADGRERFAHTAPVFVDVPGKPLRPRKAEVDYLINRVKNEIERNTGVLTSEAIEEYRAALAAYEAIAKNAK
jgi:hypothetical protein